MPQDVHAVMPDRFWACPGKQGKQKDCPALGWAYPSGHGTHASMFDASVYVPAWQSLQVAAPVTSLYSPLPQGMHDVCSALGWAYPSGHCAHASMFDAPVYVPGGQILHTLYRWY